jgi:hypothetical protein
MDEAKPNASPKSDLATISALTERLRVAVELDEGDLTQALVDSPALLAEAGNVLPVLHAASQRGAGLEGLKQVIERRYQIYPQPARATFEWDDFWAAYLDCCGTLTTASLEGAMQRWVADPASQFLPKPGQLRDLALKTPTVAAARYLRLQRSVHAARELVVEQRRAGGFHLEAVRLKHIPKPPEDRESVRAMMADFRTGQAQRAAERPKPTGNFHLSQGVPGPSGLTPLMRRHMGLPPDPDPAYLDAEGVPMPVDEGEYGAELEPFEEISPEVAAYLDRHPEQKPAPRSPPPPFEPEPFR